VAEKPSEPKIETPCGQKNRWLKNSRQTVIENIEVEKLTGPKILGKIELPVDQMIPAR
jgi:hypothetical protein